MITTTSILLIIVAVIGILYNYVMYNSYKDNCFEFPAQDGSILVFRRIFTVFALSTFVIQIVSLASAVIVLVYGIKIVTYISLLLPIIYSFPVLVFGKITKYQMEFASGMGVGNGGVMLNVIVFTPLAIIHLLT